MERYFCGPQKPCTQPQYTKYFGRNLNRPLQEQELTSKKEIVLYKRKFGRIGFEVLAGVTAKSIVFWDVTPFSPVEVYQFFEGPTASIFSVK
jgi:hypothetical protein